MKVNIEISIGELIDKLTILEIKLEKILDKSKSAEVKKELDILSIHYQNLTATSNNLDQYFDNLKKVNLKIWKMEEDIRYLIREKKFDDEFIETARKIHRTNDLRFEIKNEINKKFNSNLSEQKSYPEY
jgi:hypothetical protein